MSCRMPSRLGSLFVVALIAIGWIVPMHAADRSPPERGPTKKLASPKSTPNIVFMLSDDQGWSGTSVAMHPEFSGSRGERYHTPNLERLAARGMRFSAGYAPACVCSPTRIALQTGKNPARLHWTKAAPPEEGTSSSNRA